VLMPRIEFVPTVAPDGTVTLRAQAVASPWDRLRRMLGERKRWALRP
jgi:hypothetical protein